MAFWGVEVKPGKPFTLKASQATEIRRLHLSQATLGLGYATTRSILQCKVGNKSPLFLCILSLEKVESCQLDLDFEEADEVIFSVIGPRSVHLTGYFLSRSSFNRGNDDESESFCKKRESFGKKRESSGKNIVKRNVERASSSEDYDDSVSSIDSDDDLSSSLGLEVSSSVDEAKTKANKRNGKCERLKKKNQISDDKVKDKRKDKPLGDVKIKRKKEKRKISAIDSSDEEEKKSKKICQESNHQKRKKDRTN